MLFYIIKKHTLQQIMTIVFGRGSLGIEPSIFQDFELCFREF